MADEFRPLNLAQLYQGADAAVAQAMQTNLLTMQMSRMKREYDEEDQLRTLAMNSTATDPVTGDKRFDLKGFTRGAYSVNPMKAIGFEKAASEAEKAGLEKENLQGQIDERRMKTAADRLKHMNEASTVPYLKWKELTEGGMADEEARAKVQPLFDEARRNLVMSGMFKPDDVRQMSIMQAQQFDPTTAEAGMRQVLGAKDQLSEYWQGKNYGQRERHQTEGLQVQIRGQNITLRGQDLTDTRAREDLEQKGLEVKENEDGTYAVIDKKTRESLPVLDASGKPMVSGKAQGTQEERVAAGYATRMTAAEKIISGVSPSAQKPGTLESMGGAIPVAGNVIANELRGDARQKAVQAQMDWVRAKLRKESGAVIGPKEMEDEIRTYFPQIGDSEAVIKQKAEGRVRATEAMVQTAGRAYKPAAQKASTPQAAAAPQDGTTGTSKSGKPITYRNGRWEYD